MVGLQEALGQHRGCDDVFIRHRVDGDSLLHEPIKELSPVGGPAAVEPEGELVQVLIEVLLTHGSLVGT